MKYGQIILSLNSYTEITIYSARMRDKT